MDLHFLYGKDKLEDVSPLFTGEEACKGGYTFGPFVRSYYLIHFCISGCGFLRDKYGDHRIRAGELFIIRPGEVTVYSADKCDPWTYVWIAFNGKHADLFDCGCSVYRSPDGIAERLREYREGGVRSPYIYAALIYELIHRLFGESVSTETNDRLHNIRKYIRYNYMDNIRVSSLAREFGFERSYLYRIFKQRYGISVKEYITEIRMENARNFLNGGYTVVETAHMVGYEDEFNFSKSYKKHFGNSPSESRREQKNII